MVYIPKFTDDAIQDIKRLPKAIKNSLRNEIERVVCVNPTNCGEELTGTLAEFRSYHYEDYPVVFKLYEDLKAIAIVGIGKKNSDHYAEIYKKLEQMAGAGKLADSFLRSMFPPSGS